MTNVALQVHEDAQVMRLLARLAPSTVDDEIAPTVVFARAVWSRLIEPGDAIAGELIRGLGAVEALETLLSLDGAKAIAQAAASRGTELDWRALAAALKRWLPRLDRAESVRDLEGAVAAGLSIVVPESSEWPPTLDDLGPHAPQMLWVRGDASVLGMTSLAVVGARACTGYGSHVTAELTDAACAAGVAIVSGAAYGIDGVAHRAALAAGAPTIAVLAGGADRPYPNAHDSLLNRIAEAGVVCSEMVPGSAPTRWRFLQRNRSIAALARATLVTEAGFRSGSLNTAGHVAELGRDLGAVPGPITSAASAGCHRLIREYGATLVTNGAELREFLDVSPGTGSLVSEAGAPASATDGGGSRGGSEERQPSLHRRLIDALPLRGARSTDEAALAAGVTRVEARSGFAELEVLGHVARARDPNGGEPRWRLVKQ
ncbi:DNA-processing protein DprA [Leucobacter sp. USHLN153]|uniref:DNA-processing protein DprA n=1 Tax=Leucobacter sp. USHLN153 TaxID=3081268 RepID=UPI00301B088F